MLNYRTLTAKRRTAKYHELAQVVLEARQDLVDTIARGGDWLAAQDKLSRALRAVKSACGCSACRKE